MAALRPSRALARVFLLVGAAALLSACRIDASVDVAVRDDGSGEVHVNVGFDDEALARAGDLRLDDVRAAGWSVSGPQKEPERDASGLQWIHAIKPFAGSEQFTAIMSEIDGPNGIFRDFHLLRSTAFAKVTYSVTGTIDPTRGLDAFSDSEIAQLLGGNALGRPTADVLEETGDASLVLSIVLPGHVKGDADRVGGSRAEWDVVPGAAPTTISVHSDDVQGGARRWSIFAAILGIAAVASLVLALVRRPRRGHRRDDVRTVAASVPRLSARSAVDAGPGPAPLTTVATVRALEPGADAAPPTSRPATGNQKRIQLVVLDAMGVLYRHDDDVEALLIPFVHERGGIDDPQAIRARYVDASLGRHTTSELWSLLGVSGDPDDLDRLYTQLFELSDGVHEFLDAMLRRGIAVACCTNDVAEWSALLRRRFELDRRVHPWIVSGTVGSRKPAESMFAALEHAIDVPLRACLLVDDRIENLAAGRKLGMAVVHFAPQPVEGSPYRRVSSLFELFKGGRVTT
ncbi:MAG: HAD-IA family hydrolase [Acidimicrobiales bacterium]